MRIGSINKKQERMRTIRLWGLLFFIILLYPAINLLSSNKTSKKKKQTESANQIAVVDSFSETTIEIDLKKNDYEKLAEKRKEALKSGLLFSSKDDLVPATIRIGEKSYSCKIRLKGDLMDHLKGAKWSFRIVLDNDEEWRGMNTFSIHNSKARSHTAEWLMHNMFKDEGIVVPDYDFINVKLNDQYLGVYAYEHHFEDQLLVRNEKKVGPILKHTDDAYWENVNLKLKKFPWIEASNIELFNKQSLNEDSFKTAYEYGYANLSAFIAEEVTAKEVFDIDIMARYYALMDVTHAWHAQAFTNIRFYLNPNTGKMEPVGYDCFGDYLHIITKNWDAFGEGVNSNASKEEMYQRNNVYRYLLFKDYDFFEKYMRYLSKYTEKEYINRIRSKYKHGLDNRIAFIKTDPDYEKFEDNWDQMIMKAAFINKKIDPKPSLSLKALRVDGSASHIEFSSFHNFPLDIHGFGDENQMTDTLSESLIIEAYNNKLPPINKRYVHSRKIKYIYFSTLGLDEIYKTKLNNISVPKKLAVDSNVSVSDFSKWPFVTKTKKTISIMPGNHILTEPLIVPENHTLEIASNARIQFKSKGQIISYGKINAIGSRQEPIIFYADESQKTGGIFISTPSEKSTFYNCRFLRLTGVDEKGIRSDAALTLHKTEADLRHCVFQDIAAKEALSLHHTKLILRNCQLYNCQGKGIDSHYSNLSLIDFKMINLGDHGIYMRSGHLSGEKVDVEETLQTGLYITDNAEVYFHSFGIRESYQGLYVNKHSEVKIENLWLTKLERGIECRGTEEPSTQLTIGKLHDKEIENLYLLKQGITIQVNGQSESGS